jgi:hypothetical protein
MTTIRRYFVLTLPVLSLALMSPSASAADRPVKVYILSGQSNMVGIGQVTGGGSRWGSEFIAPVFSVYAGKYDPDIDYEQNLVHLINTLRKEFDAPKAPFVIATIGFDGWKMSGPHKTVAAAQLVVSGEKARYPQFRGNVLTVETRDFWREPEVSPRNQGFHYNQNAETYMLVGEALGKGMLELLKAGNQP